MLYEERIFHRGFAIIILAPFLIASTVGGYAVYIEKEGFEIFVIGMGVTFLMILDACSLKIEIDEREIRLRGVLGLIMRKTIRIEDIRSFEVSEGWLRCSGFIHFNLPAKACIAIYRKRGVSVSFTTNNPEEIASILATLGVPRELSIR